MIQECCRGSPALANPTVADALYDRKTVQTTNELMFLLNVCSMHAAECARTRVQQMTPTETTALDWQRVAPALDSTAMDALELHTALALPWHYSCIQTFTHLFTVTLIPCCMI